MALPEIDAWRVENLRFTFFYSEPQTSLSGWWKAITGADPDQVVSRPHVNEHTEIGPFLDGQLELKSAFNRIDWTYSNPFAGVPDSAPTKSLSELREEMLPAIQRWLDTQGQNIIRVAFGTVGMLSVSSIVEGNVLLRSYVPFLNVEPEKVEDIFLQVNTPEFSKVAPDFRCNIISKWGVMTGQFMTMVLGGLPKMVTNQVLRSEFDHSTPADQSEALANEFLVPLLNEFFDKAFCVLQEGVKK